MPDLSLRSCRFLCLYSLHTPRSPKSEVRDSKTARRNGVPQRPLSIGLLLTCPPSLSFSVSLSFSLWRHGFFVESAREARAGVLIVCTALVSRRCLGGAWYCCNSYLAFWQTRHTLASLLVNACKPESILGAGGSEIAPRPGASARRSPQLAAPAILMDSWLGRLAAGCAR